MQRKPVQSSNIASVGYDPETQTLEIEFHGGGVYRYFDVPVATYDKLMASGSVGKTFREAVNGRFQFEKVEAKSE